MTLCEELLWGCLRDLPVQVAFPNLTVDPNDLVEMKSILAIGRIRHTSGKRRSYRPGAHHADSVYHLHVGGRRRLPFKTRKKKKGPAAPFLFLTLLFFCPIQSTAHSLAPAAQQLLPLLFLHLRQIPFLRLPGGADFVQIPAIRPPQALLKMPRPAPLSPATPGRSTGRPIMSAWNCIKNRLAEAPPSTRRFSQFHAGILLHRVQHILQV